MTTTTTTTTRTTPFSFVPTEDSAIVSMGVTQKHRGEGRGVSYTSSAQQGGIQVHQHTTTTTDPQQPSSPSGFAAAAAPPPPLGDVVSPLRTDQQLDSYTSYTDNEEEDPHTPPPPVGEIRIPTLSARETQYHRYRHQPINYEQLYFLSVRRNYRMKQKFCCVAEENRRLKRHLIELQKRLFSSTRNNKRTAADAWTVPTNNNKRRHCSSSSVPQSVVSTEEQQPLEESPSP